MFRRYAWRLPVRGSHPWAVADSGVCFRSGGGWPYSILIFHFEFKVNNHVRDLRLRNNGYYAYPPS
jgi:hypothetical protein